MHSQNNAGQPTTTLLRNDDPYFTEIEIASCENLETLNFWFKEASRSKNHLEAKIFRSKTDFRYKGIAAKIKYQEALLQLLTDRIHKLRLATKKPRVIGKPRIRKVKL